MVVFLKFQLWKRKNILVDNRAHGFHCNSSERLKSTRNLGKNNQKCGFLAIFDEKWSFLLLFCPSNASVEPNIFCVGSCVCVGPKWYRLSNLRAFWQGYEWKKLDFPSILANFGHCRLILFLNFWKIVNLFSFPCPTKVLTPTG